MLNTTLTKIALTVGVVVSGVGFMVYSSVGNAQHYKMVDELMVGDLAQWEGKSLQVHGWVEAGSIIQKAVASDGAVHRTFILQKGGRRIRVFNVGPIPDTFKDLSEVVATGHLVKAATMKPIADALGIQLDTTQPYVVDSSELMAKCPSKYDGAQVNKSINKPHFGSDAVDPNANPTGYPGAAPAGAQ